MARIDWVRQKLENWARWCAQRDDGGTGYPSQTAFARLGGKGSRSEAVIPILSIEAEQTDQAVRSLRLSQSHLYLVLTWHYAQNMTIQRVALRMGKAESTIKRNLEDADHALARWFNDRKAAAEARAA